MTRPPHRLFFAIQPTPAAAASALDLARRLQAGQHLPGRPIEASHLHVTLHWLQDHDSLPMDLVAQALQAGAGVEIAPFDVAFDEIGSLGEPGHGGPVVLTGSAGLAALRKFQRMLAAAMNEAGIGAYIRKTFRPHVTLLYTDPHVPPQPIETLRWTVRELVLIDSWIKPEHRRADYEILGRWPLQSRQAGFADW